MKLRTILELEDPLADVQQKMYLFLKTLKLSFTRISGPTNSSIILYVEDFPSPPNKDRPTVVLLFTPEMTYAALNNTTAEQARPEYLNEIRKYAAAYQSGFVKSCQQDADEDWSQEEIDEMAKYEYYIGANKYIEGLATTAKRNIINRALQNVGLSEPEFTDLGIQLDDIDGDDPERPDHAAYYWQFRFNTVVSESALLGFATKLGFTDD